MCLSHSGTQDAQLRQVLTQMWEKSDLQRGDKWEEQEGGVRVRVAGHHAQLYNKPLHQVEMQTAGVPLHGGR